MIGMTDLIVTSTSRMLISDLVKSYKKNDTIRDVVKGDCQFTISFPTNIYNDEKEGIFATLVEKIIRLRDPSDKQMDTKVEVRYLQQASKEYFFVRGELVRYRGFFDTDNPIPMVTRLIGQLHI